MCFGGSLVSCLSSPRRFTSEAASCRLTSPLMWFFSNMHVIYVIEMLSNSLLWRISGRNWVPRNGASLKFKLVSCPVPLQVFKLKAVQLAEKLLPAFNTPTGIPWAIVNLKRSVIPRMKNLFFFFWALTQINRKWHVTLSENRWQPRRGRAKSSATSFTHLC